MKATEFKILTSTKVNSSQRCLQSPWMLLSDFCHFPLAPSQTTCPLLLFSKSKAQDLIKSKSLTYVFLIIIETCCLFHKGDSLPTQVWTSSYLTCWRPHHKVAGWCQEMDLVWMTCSGREEWSLSFSWGVPADTCHQVHGANEIWGAASSPTLPPSLWACLLEKCSSLLILENWGIHNTLRIIFLQAGV